MDEPQKSVGTVSVDKGAGGMGLAVNKTANQDDESDGVLEDYIKPADKAGIFSLPIMILTGLTSFFMLSIMTLTLIDVSGRYIFNNPVRGGVELIEFLLGLLIFSALPLVSVKKAHITVQLFDNFMAPILKKYRGVLISLVSATMIAFITERMFSTGFEAYEAEDISMHLDLPMAPILFALTVLSAISFVVQIYMVWQSIQVNFLTE